jgi:hypothetical protein
MPKLRGCTILRHLFFSNQPATTPYPVEEEAINGLTPRVLIGISFGNSNTQAIEKDYAAP